MRDDDRRKRIQNVVFTGGGEVELSERAAVAEKFEVHAVVRSNWFVGNPLVVFRKAVRVDRAECFFRRGEKGGTGSTHIGTPATATRPMASDVLKHEEHKGSV